MPLSTPPTKPYVGNGASPATRYWCASSVEPGAGTSAIIANQMYAQPVNLPGLVVDRIGLEVTVLGVGAARLGIYSNNPATGLPGDLLVDVGTVDTGSAAILEANFSTPFVLPEWCWIVAVFSVVSTVRIGAARNADKFGFSLTTGSLRGFVAAFTYGALPAAFPGSPAYISACPMILLRKS